MSALVDELDLGIDPQSEVKKLQDLVKKLELQNQVLRSKQKNDISTPIRKQDLNVNTDNNHRLSPSSRIFDSNRASTSLDEVELLDLESSISEEEEESWLYECPTSNPTSAQKDMSPYKWLREDLEHPSPEMKSVRRSLMCKLDEMSKVIRSPSSASLPDPIVASDLAYEEKEFSPLREPVVPGKEPSPPPVIAAPEARLPPPSSQSLPKPSLRAPGSSGGSSSGINTNTFVRRKKPTSQLPSADTAPVDNGDSGSSDEPISFVSKFGHQRANSSSPRGLTPQDSPRHSPRSSPAGLRGEWEPREGQPSQPEGLRVPEKSANPQKLEEVMDVHMMARMQAESLRQSISTPFNAKKNEAIKRSNQSLDSLGSSGSSGTPGSPYGSSQYLHNPSVNGKSQPGDTHRRSLPNIARSGLSVRPNASDSKLAAKSSSQIPGSGHRVPRTPGSGARQSSPGRTLSPPRRTIPSPRQASGIPRPGSASRLPTPRKSSIPSMRRTMTAPKATDDSWRDGCF